MASAEAPSGPTVRAMWLMIEILLDFFIRKCAKTLGVMVLWNI